MDFLNSIIERAVQPEQSLAPRPVHRFESQIQERRFDVTNDDSLEDTATVESMEFSSVPLETQSIPAADPEVFTPSSPDQMLEMTDRPTVTTAQDGHSNRSDAQNDTHESLHREKPTFDSAARERKVATDITEDLRVDLDDASNLDQPLGDNFIVNSDPESHSDLERPNHSGLEIPDSAAVQQTTKEQVVLREVIQGLESSPVTSSPQHLESLSSDNQSYVVHENVTQAEDEFTTSGPIRQENTGKLPLESAIQELEVSSPTDSLVINTDQAASSVPIVFKDEKQAVELKTESSEEETVPTQHDWESSRLDQIPDWIERVEIPQLESESRRPLVQDLDTEAHLAQALQFQSDTTNTEKVIEVRIGRIHVDAGPRQSTSHSSQSEKRTNVVRLQDYLERRRMRRSR